MTSRSKRTSKIIDYAAVDNPFSDDDFSDFTPPSTKKKKKEKTKKRENDRKNEEVIELDLDKENVQTQKSVKEKGPRQWLSLEERKFQRELDKALELSIQGPSVAEDFQSFKKGKDNEQDIATATSTPEEPNSPLSPIFNAKNVVTLVDIHSTFSGDETETRNFSSKAKETLQDSLEEEPLPATFSRLAAKRPRKKVQFIEDDDSDEWNSDIEAIKILSDDSEESDFCPSPQLKKKKKNVTNQKSKSSSRPQPSSKAAPKINEPNSKKLNERSPLKLKQNVSVKIAPSVVRKDYDQASKVTTTSILPSSSSLSPVYSLVPKSAKVSATPSPSKSTFIPSRVGLMKKPFKSPTISSSSSPSTLLQSPSAVSRSGLRLGLSRKAYVKPLHPNTFVK